MWIEDDGVLRQVFDVTVVRIEHMEEVYAAMLDLGGQDGGWRVLVDLRAVRWGTPSTREYAAGRSLARMVHAQAIVVGSSVGRMLASFFVRVSQPPFPVRVFDSVPLAMDWLRTATPANVSRARAAADAP